MDPLTIAAIGTTGINLVSGLLGKSAQAKKQRKHNQWLDNQQTQLDAWYNKEKNTKYLDTAEGQGIYQGMRRLLKENGNRVDNTLVKTGGTTESRLAANEQANQTLASTASNMAATDTTRKQNLNSQYQGQSGQLRSLRGSNMQSDIAGSANTSANALGALSGGLQTIFSGLASAKKPQATPTMTDQPLLA